MPDTTLLDGPRVAPAAGGDAKSLVILLHGYGSNGDDLISLAPYWRSLLPHTAFVSPNAPEVCPGAPGGYQWWGITGMDPAQRSAGVSRAAPILQGFIDAELARHGLAEDRLALVGFSQGTMMALHVATSRTREVAGVVGYSGMIADPAAISAANSKPPVLLVHGDADPMIPVQAFSTAMTMLAQAGIPVSGHVSPGLQHSIDEAGLRLGGGFLARSLA